VERDFRPLARRFFIEQRRNAGFEIGQAPLAHPVFVDVLGARQGQDEHFFPRTIQGGRQRLATGFARGVSVKRQHHRLQSRKRVGVHPVQPAHRRGPRITAGQHAQGVQHTLTEAGLTPVSGRLVKKSPLPGQVAMRHAAGNSGRNRPPVQIHQAASPGQRKNHSACHGFRAVRPQQT